MSSTKLRRMNSVATASKLLTTQKFLPEEKERVLELVKVAFVDPTEFDTRYGICDDPIECVTIGWLVEMDRRKIRIAWILDKEDKEGTAGLILPRGCVKEITKIEQNADGEFR
jgi:hypothetical protein